MRQKNDCFPDALRTKKDPVNLQARHYATGNAIEVKIEGPRIASVRELDCSPNATADLPFISPGFFDIQVNGYNGVWFSSPTLTVDQVIDICQSLVNAGIARFFPTLITASFDALAHGFATLQQAVATNKLVSQCVVGYHLEGPFISAEDGPRGAHPLQHVRDASYEEFQQLQKFAAGRIRLVTLAAESPNAVEFIRRCRQDNVVVALGHTAATTQQILAAVDAGAQLSTHFGNGAHGMMPRHPNYLWDQLAEDRLWASVIADGCHLPASVLQCVVKCKTAEHTILTCDVSGFAGCPPGIYAEGDIGVEVLQDGRLVVAGQQQFLAGSGVTTGDCVVHMMASCGISRKEAVEMATRNPSQLLGESNIAIEKGQIATLTLFRTPDNPVHGRPTFAPIATYVQGELMSV